MTSIFRNSSLSFASFISLLLAGTFLAILKHFSHIQLIPCTDIWATNLILSLALVFLLQIFLAPKILPTHYKSFLAGHVGLILLVLWLGFYSISPLGYSAGRIPVLRGFLVISANRSSVVPNRGLISVSQGSVVAIQPLMLAGKFHCNWMSATGGQLDLPTTCDIIYVPPNVEYDILRFRVQTSCGLPDAIGQIKVAVLP